jgi:hypothetical protein
MRRAAIGLVTTALVATAVAPASAGDTERVRTRVTISDECGGFDCRAVPRQRNYTATFSGRVKSQVGRCERRRLVKLYREVIMRGESEFRQIDSTRSDRQGRWEIVRTDKPGFLDYYALAPRAERGDVVCKAGRSPIEHHGP